MKRAASAVLAACLCAAAALSGCRQGPATSAEPSASAAPEGKPGIALKGLRIVLPRVADRPAAMYFELTNAGTARATLVGVYVDGANKADMHETVGDAMKPLTKIAIDPGATVSFAPGGKHVMVYRIPGTWKGSDKPAVTLKFADGDKISGKAALEKAQGADAVPDNAAGTMPRMKM